MHITLYPRHFERGRTFTTMSNPFALALAEQNPFATYMVDRRGNVHNGLHTIWVIDGAEQALHVWYETGVQLCKAYEVRKYKDNG